MATDFFDGYLARKWNQISELGKILDPIADKVNIGGVVIALYFFQDFPLWLTLLIVLRDVAIMLGALLIIKTKQKVTPSNMPGKITVVVVALTIIMFLLGWFTIFNYLLYVVILSILYSAYSYLMVFLKFLNKSK